LDARTIVRASLIYGVKLGVFSLKASHPLDVRTIVRTFLTKSDKLFNQINYVFMHYFN
jgi:hypothetical protein